MNFLVAGCGIGGLSAAHALMNLGHHVRLVERAPELKPVGAGISLQPNAMQAIKRLGLDQAIGQAAWDADVAQILTSKGKLLKQFDFSNYEGLFGFLPSTIYRGDLIRVLAEELDQSKSEIVLGEQVESFHESADKVIVKTDKGNEFECDGLIGADGIRSAIRRQLWGEPKARYSGYTCWRGMVEDPALVEQVDIMTEAWGTGSRFGFMRCNEKQVYWFATENRKSRTDHIKDQSWKSIFETWVDPISKLVEATPEDEIVHGDIIDLKPIFPWGQGRVTLLGDAAHAMTPNFGQGGAQAIEDAVVLGLALKAGDPLENSFRAYESARNPRTTSLVKGSWQFGKIGQGKNLMLRLVRNHLMPNLPKKFVDKQLAIQCDFEAYLQRSLLAKDRVRIGV